MIGVLSVLKNTSLNNGYHYYGGRKPGISQTKETHLQVARKPSHVWSEIKPADSELGCESHGLHLK